MYRTSKAMSLLLSSFSNTNVFYGITPPNILKCRNKKKVEPFMLVLAGVKLSFLTVAGMGLCFMFVLSTGFFCC